MDKRYKQIGIWKKKFPMYKCNECPFETLEEMAMLAHLRSSHPIKRVIEKDVPTSIVDETGSSLHMKKKFLTEEE